MKTQQLSVSSSGQEKLHISCVQELSQNIVFMSQQRDILQRQIEEEEGEYLNTQKELILLNEWVEKYNRDLSELNTEKREIAKTITETQFAKNRIHESYHSLLSYLQKECHNNNNLHNK